MLALDITKHKSKSSVSNREFLVSPFPSEEKQLDRSLSRMWKAWFKVMSSPTHYLNIQD